jgi:hypothetical protein
MVVAVERRNDHNQGNHDEHAHPDDLNCSRNGKWSPVLVSRSHAREPI